MTAIAALVQNNAVYIGGDSAGVGGYDVTVRSDPKVFRNGMFLIGIAGSFRYGNILRYLYTPPKPQDVEVFDPMRYMATTFITTLRDAMEENGIDDDEQEGQCLIGYKGRLYFIGSDYQVGAFQDHFGAIGCGAQIIHGALYATRRMHDPVKRIKLALTAAERFSAGVCGPFVVERLEE